MRVVSQCQKAPKMAVCIASRCLPCWAASTWRCVMTSTVSLTSGFKVRGPFFYFALTSSYCDSIAYLQHAWPHCPALRFVSSSVRCALLLGIDVSVLVQARETQVSARLRDIVVMDVDPNTIHKKVHRIKNKNPCILVAFRSRTGCSICRSNGQTYIHRYIIYIYI